MNNEASNQKKIVRYTISCNNVPEELFDKNNAKNHFRQFGRVLKIVFRQRQKSCLIDYDSLESAEKAVSQGSIFNDSEFNIKLLKLPEMPAQLVEIKPKKKDPDWPNDPEIQAELDALGEIIPHHHDFRTKAKELKPAKKSPVATRGRKSMLMPRMKFREKLQVPKKKILKVSKKQDTKPKKRPIDLTQVAELVVKIKQAAQNSTDKYNILEARDKLIRIFSKHNLDAEQEQKVIGTCPDMCPEKERYLRESKHQISIYEQTPDSPTSMNHSTAIKQYSRSSADQEMPLPHELRPVSVLQLTMSYLLHNIIDLCDSDQVNIGEWYHFVWDRTRSIRKDITQQQLCCHGSVELVEQCARFHIHCAEILIEEDVSIFDTKINTENLTKCLQTLKYMYHDLELQGIYCPNEAEFRGYIILLNLNDANFMWEVKQLRTEIQQSVEIKFAIKVFLALESNNFVNFFKLVRSTTYLNACILLRYFNDVRYNAINRMIRTHSPRVMLTQFPIVDLTRLLAFEDDESTRAFLQYYGLEMSDVHVILSRKEFIRPTLPYETYRAINIIESKRTTSVGELICGKDLPSKILFENHTLQNSFDEFGHLKRDEIKQEWLKTVDSTKITTDLPSKSGVKSSNIFKIPNEVGSNLDIKDTFVFTKPADVSKAPNIFAKPSDVKPTNLFLKTSESKNIFGVSQTISKSMDIVDSTSTGKTHGLFSKPAEIKPTISSSQKSIFGDTKTTPSVFGVTKPTNIFTSNTALQTSVFSAPKVDVKPDIFISAAQKPQIFASTSALDLQKSTDTKPTIFATPIISRDPRVNRNLTPAVETHKPIETNANIFTTSITESSATRIPSLVPIGVQSTSKTNIFGATPTISESKLISKPTLNIFSSKKNTSSNEPVSSTTVSFGNFQKPENKLVTFVAGNKADSTVTTLPDNSKTFQAKPNIFTAVPAMSSSNLGIFAKKKEAKESKTLFAAPTATASIFQPKPGIFSSSTDISQSKMTSERKQLDFLTDPKTMHMFSSGSTSPESVLQDDLRKQEEERTRLAELARKEEIRRKFEEEQEAAKKREQQENERKEREREMQRQEEEAKRREVERLLEQQRLREVEEARKREEARQMEIKRREIEEAELRAQLLAQMEAKRREEAALAAAKKQEEELVRKRHLEQIERERIAQELINNLIDTIEHNEIQERLNQIKINILVRQIITKWRHRVQTIKKRKAAVENSPIWIPKRSYIQEANELYTTNQEVALLNMQRYKLRNNSKIRYQPDDDMFRKINFTTEIFYNLKENLEKNDNCILNTIFWKIIVNLPDENESKFHLNKLYNVIDNIFPLKKAKENLFLDSIKPNHSDTLNISIQLIFGVNYTKINDNSDLIFFGINNREYLKNMSKRLFKFVTSTSKNQNLVIILRNTYNDESEMNLVKILNLNNFIDQKLIRNYLIIYDKNHTNDELITGIEKGINFLAHNTNGPPHLEMNLIMDFLQMTLGQEFAQRLKYSSKNNLGLTIALTDCETIINLHNEAVQILQNFVLNSNLDDCPDFPEELKQFVPPTHTYPCTYEYFPKYWRNKSYRGVIQNYFHYLILPDFKENWPPLNISELKIILSNYCCKIIDEKHFENIYLQILTVVFQFFENGEDIIDMEQIDIDNFPWLDIFQIIINYKISMVNNLVINFDKIIIYDKNDLEYYQKCAWWLNSSTVIGKIEKFTEEIDLNRSVVDTPKILNYDDFNIDDKLNELLSYQSVQEQNKIIEQRHTDLSNFKHLIDDLDNAMKIQRKAIHKFCDIVEKELVSD